MPPYDTIDHDLNYDVKPLCINRFFNRMGRPADEPILYWYLMNDLMNSYKR